MRLRLPGRFEWKILGGVLLVAALCLAAAASFLAYTMRNFEAYTNDHEDKVRASLGSATDVFRAYFAERKEAFHRRAEDVAAGPPAHLSEMAAEPDLLGAKLLEGDRVVDEWEAAPEMVARARPAPPILVAIGGSEPPRLLELTFGIPRGMYDNFLALRDTIEREHDLGRVYPLLLPAVFRGFLIASALLVAFAALVGMTIARQATRRVAALRDAARRVGEGDLGVRLAPSGKDELAELGRAFDRMVAELGDARSRLEYLQKVGAWQEVARRLAHEIKNPLTPIQLAMQELASKYAGDDAAYRRLLDTASEILREEIGALRRLVDDFSAFAKLPKVDPQPVDLADVVEDFVRAHPEWQPFVRFARPAAPVPAGVDRMMMRRALANLVENAVQAAEGAGRTPEVRLSVEGREGGGAALLVDDNGPGIAPEARAHVFDPYMTTKEHGTGLGLAIVRKIVIDHGGDVTVGVAPPPLGGARFTVEIAGTTGPAQAPAPGPPASP